jgi:hypothetical protein
MKYAENLIEDIIQALDKADFETRYYFNKETWGITSFSDYGDYDEDEENELDLSKWVNINEIDSFEKYNLMEDFAVRQNDRLRELINVALNGKGAFRRFKDVLYSFPEEQEKWYEFEHEWLKQQAIDFLDGIYESDIFPHT